MYTIEVRVPCSGALGPVVERVPVSGATLREAIENARDAYGIDVSCVFPLRLLVADQELPDLEAA